MALYNYVCGKCAGNLVYNGTMQWSVSEQEMVVGLWDRVPYCAKCGEYTEEKEVKLD